MATRKVRYKKLSVKTLLSVLREDQIDPTEYESLTNEAQIATGVEQAEENVSENLRSSSPSRVTCECTCHVYSYLHQQHLDRGLTDTDPDLPGIPSPGRPAECGGRCGPRDSGAASPGEHPQL
jgi:hypothetical protein